MNQLTDLSIGGILIFVILALLSLTLYFLPFIVASLRNHHNITAIFVLNLLAGWTFVGWVIALVWSFTAVDRDKSKEVAATKKLLFAILGIFSVLVLIVVMFVGGIAWFTFHTIGNSEAAETARTFLRSNEQLKQEIGEVKDFGSFVTGQINVQNANGEASLHIKVIGERKTVNATVDLSYRSNRNWRVTGASYERDGQTIDLMRPYEEPAPSP